MLSSSVLESAVHGCLIAALAFLSSSAIAACATLDDATGGDDQLPNAAIGPFRVLAVAELGNTRVAPYVLGSANVFTRNASVLDADGDPATLQVFGYAAEAAPAKETDASTPASRVVRYQALDGRSFDRSGSVVLEAKQGWEGGQVDSPHAERVGTQVFLYYAAKGGIGLAKSDDGRAFTRLEKPVLDEGPAGSWEAGLVPASPSVVRLSDGSFQMFYEVRGPSGSRIGEARSPDGEQWTRRGAPVLGPVGLDDSGAGAPDAKGVRSPFALADQSPIGRSFLRLFYTAEDGNGITRIAVASRTGSDDPFVRATAPVFGGASALGPVEPCVVRFAIFSLLYVTERSSKGEKAYPAVAAAVAPADAVLPPPEPK